MKMPEEIKKGLECCINVKGCVGCPYRINLDDCDSEQLERDALAYIQQLEQALFIKPLSWDEAMGDDAFLEIKGDEYIDAALNLFACCTIDNSLKDGFVYYETHNNDELKFLEIDYGKTWRCWARRPTDEEREAAKWEV